MCVKALFADYKQFACFRTLTYHQQIAKKFAHNNLE